MASIHSARASSLISIRTGACKLQPQFDPKMATASDSPSLDDKRSISPKLKNIILGLPMAIVSGFLQSLKQSPLETHYDLVVMILIAVIIYVLAIMVQFKYTHDSSTKIASDIRLVFGILVIILVIAILVPFLGWSVFVLWTFWVAHGLYVHIYPEFSLEALQNRARVAFIEMTSRASSDHDSQTVTSDSMV